MIQTQQDKISNTKRTLVTFINDYTPFLYRTSTMAIYDQRIQKFRRLSIIDSDLVIALGTGEEK